MSGAVFTKAEVVAKSAVGKHTRDYGDIFKPQSSFLDLTYAELEEMNLEVKKDRLRGVSAEEFEKKFIKYLEEEKGIKAVTVAFTDLEGRFHVLDYDKKFVLGSHDNLTFDGSSIKGFTVQSESDLRLKIDWSSFRWLPADVFGAGKVLVFGGVCEKNGTPYVADYRSNLVTLAEELKKEGTIVNIAPEIEGFLFKGVHAEQSFDEEKGFELVTMSGYFNSLPQDELRLFIDKVAEVQRAVAFQNEKDHPEVAPAQFELNFRYSHAVDTADQVQIYKLVSRQVARHMGLTACFLPKPIQGINGSGMHTNISLEKAGKNIFFGADDKYNLSKDAYKFITGILYYANDLCLAINSSVNAYRRLDPHFEAPNEIKVSPTDRGSMVRIPIGNEKSARIEVRTVAPDANPYLAFFTLVKAGLAGVKASEAEMKTWEKKVYTKKVAKLPGDIYSALEAFKKSKFMEEVMGKMNKEKYLSLKMNAADRCPRALGTRVKVGEILYHHDITNQVLWNSF